MAMGMDMGMGGGLDGAVDAAEPDADDMGAEAYEPKDDFEREAMDAFDTAKPMGERMMAFREAVKLCSEEDYGADSGPEKKSGSGLALVFGAPKKKG